MHNKKRPWQYWFTLIWWWGSILLISSLLFKMLYDPNYFGTHILSKVGVVLFGAGFWCILTSVSYLLSKKE